MSLSKSDRQTALEAFRKDKGVSPDMSEKQLRESYDYGDDMLDTWLRSWQLATQAADTPFRDTVTDALVVSHIYAKEHDTNPLKAIADLTSWETKIALDPAVSSEAQALIDKGAQAAYANAAKIADDVNSETLCSWCNDAADLACKFRILARESSGKGEKG